MIGSFQAGEFESSYSCSGTGNANGTCTSDSECAGVCIGNNTALSFDENTGYIKLLGFDIEGGVYSLGGATVGARPPLEVDDMDIMYGWGAWTGGGNWAGFYVREMRDRYIHNSRIHDIYAHGDNLTNAAVNIFYVSNATRT